MQNGAIFSIFFLTTCLLRIISTQDKPKFAGEGSYLRIIFLGRNCSSENCPWENSPRGVI